MLEARFRPFEKPPTPPKGGRRHSPFKASWTRVLDDLEREMRHLGAKDIIIEAETTLDWIRNDGWPYSSAKFSGPSIAISFTSKHGPMRFECGTYWDWQDNIRAVGLTLESLRAVDRYGATKTAEQYRGFSALPASIQGAEWLSVEDAMRFLCKVGDGELLSVLPKDLRQVYHFAAKKAHPDAGGSEQLMDKVNRARDFVEAATKGAAA